MPLRHLTGRVRSRLANIGLASMLAFAAGLVDVSGYMALKQFTSHMTGAVAAMAAGLGEGEPILIARCGLVVASFLSGAATCALLVNFSRRRDRESLFALPLLLEALLLAALGLLHAAQAGLVLWLLLAGLGFTMGLQNAIITKISDADIRTTHITGMVTDIGIELGRALYLNRNAQHEPIRVHRQRLGMLMLLVSCFTSGAVFAAFTYPRVGFHVFVPLAVVLATPTVLPILSDLRAAFQPR